MAAHRFWRIRMTANNASNWILLAEVKMFLRGTATNVANQGAASASGSNSSAGNARDGNTGSYWEYANSQAWPQWWQIDFGAGNEKDIGQIDITSYSSWPEEMPRNFEFQWSDDGSAFTTAFTYSRIFWTGSQTQSFAVPGANDANYYAYRLNIQSVNGASYASVAELQVKSAVGGTNLALAKAAFDTGTSGAKYAKNAFDGALGSEWEIAATTGAVGAIFPSPFVPAQFGVGASTDSAKLAALPKDFQFQGTKDGLAWDTLATVTGQTGWSVNEIRTYLITFASTTTARPQVFVCT